MKGLEDHRSSLQEFIHPLSRSLRFRRKGFCPFCLLPLFLRVGVGEVIPQSFPTKEDDKTMLSPGINENLSSLHLLYLVLQSLAEFFVLFCRYPPGPSVDDLSLFIDRCKIPSCGQIVPGQMKIDPHGLQHPSSDLVVKRVVAEEG